MVEFFQGFIYSFSIIAAIGVQNSYLINEAFRQRPFRNLVIYFASADTALMALGIFLSHLIRQMSQPAFVLLTWVAVAFIGVYAARCLMRVIAGGYQIEESGQSTRKQWAIASAFTFMNPHVYLDTLLLIGIPSAQFSFAAKAVYYLGAVLASWCWFSAIALLARKAGSYLRSPLWWRVIDAITATIMVSIAYWLLTQIGLFQ